MQFMQKLKTYIISLKKVIIIMNVNKVNNDIIIACNFK